MRASTLAYTVAVACLLVCGANADAGAAPTLQLPGSTGGVPVTLVSLDGTQAFFTNDTFSVFKVDYVSFTVEASVRALAASQALPACSVRDATDWVCVRSVFSLTLMKRCTASRSTVGSTRRTPPRRSFTTARHSATC